MSDREKSNEPLDHFSQYVRQRLKNNPCPPDQSCWDEIDMRMQKKRRLSPLWLGLAIAASVIVAVFILDNITTEKEYHMPDMMSEIEERAVETSIPVEIVIPEVKYPEILSEQGHKDINADVTNKNTGKKSFAILPVQRNMDVMEEDAIIIHETVEVEVSEAEDIKEPRAGNFESYVEKISEVQEEVIGVQEDTDRRQFRNLENLTAYSHDNQSAKKHKWQVSAGLGYGGEFEFLQGSSDIGREGDMVSPGDNNNVDEGNGEGGNDGNSMYENIRSRNKIISQEEITDMTHSAPISFGITVRKRLNRTLGIETGLMYTYLSTDFKINGATNNYDATLNLHYLGIPANLIVNILDKRQWNIYVSGGGMVEKGLQSVYKQRTIYKSDNNKEKNSVSGLQWSLNGGIGISYNFYKDINLYIEPGVSYYFDCNQPISKRTEDPFNFNLKLGFRYDF